MNFPKNLSQLKGALKEGAKFAVVFNRSKPEFSGQQRVVQVAQTNGIYSGISGEPNNALSKANGGRGYWMSFGNASNWSFADDGVCCYYASGHEHIDSNALFAIKVVV